METSIVREAIAAGGGNPELALFAAVRMVRWKMMIAGDLTPFEGEWLPNVVEEEIERGAS